MIQKRYNETKKMVQKTTTKKIECKERNGTKIEKKKKVLEGVREVNEGHEQPRGCLGLYLHSQ